MNPMSLTLKTAVVLAALYALVALSVLVVKTLAFGKRPLYAEAKGSSAAGIYYAFTTGMMPWEKESARKHLPVYLAGVSYHAGVFAALLYLCFQVFSVSAARPFVQVLTVFLLLGSSCGLALLVRRASVPSIRALSCPDDYFSNILVTLFVILAAAHSLYSWSASSSLSPAETGHGARSAPVMLGNALFLAATLMFLYAPVGKVRHCFFFFLVRILFGAFYGRRAALSRREEVSG